MYMGAIGKLELRQTAEGVPQQVNSLQMAAALLTAEPAQKDFGPLRSERANESVM